MKNFLGSVVVLFGLMAASSGDCAPFAAEAPVIAYGTPTTVSVSESAWTKVPASQTINGRMALIVDVPATSNANMVGHLGDCTSTSIATTVRPLEFIKSSGFAVIGVNPGVCLWMLSLHSGAENVHVQEVKQ